jgi:hypothetical protein
MNATDSTTRGSVPERQPSGWVIFAGVALLIVGPLDALYGLAAILNNQIVIVGGNGVIVADITTWGWVHLILGSLVALAGLGLFAGDVLRSLGCRLLRRRECGFADRLVSRCTHSGRC